MKSVAVFTLAFLATASAFSAPHMILGTRAVGKKAPAKEAPVSYQCLVGNWSCLERKCIQVEFLGELKEST